MTLGLLLLSLISAYRDKNHVLNYKKHKLDFKEHVQRTPTVTKTFSIGFNHNAELPYKKINLKDKAFLEKFFVKESSILIGVENLGATEFPIMSWLRWYYPHQSKNDQMFTQGISNPNQTPLDCSVGLRDSTSL